MTVELLSGPVTEPLVSSFLATVVFVGGMAGGLAALLICAFFEWRAKRNERQVESEKVLRKVLDRRDRDIVDQLRRRHWLPMDYRERLARFNGDDHA